MNLNDLYLFVQAVDAGSMSAAARRLDLPKSTVSKRVAELERTLHDPAAPGRDVDAPDLDAVHHLVEALAKARLAAEHR